MHISRARIGTSSLLSWLGIPFRLTVIMYRTGFCLSKKRLQ